MDVWLQSGTIGSKINMKPYNHKKNRQVILKRNYQEKNYKPYKTSNTYGYIAFKWNHRF